MIANDPALHDYAPQLVLNKSLLDPSEAFATLSRLVTTRCKTTPLLPKLELYAAHEIFAPFLSSAHKNIT